MSRSLRRPPLSRKPKNGDPVRIRRPFLLLLALALLAGCATPGGDPGAEIDGEPGTPIPLVFGWEPGERVYADLLSLVRWESDADGRSSWDGPLNLFGYRRDADGKKSLRLLWWFEIPLGGGDE